MRDLRRRALESNKTVSRKAQSKQASPAPSRPGSAPASRAASRAVSRAGSDDEDAGGNLSDETSFRSANRPPRAHSKSRLTNGASVGSLNEILNSEAPESTDTWRDALNERMDEIIDRKRSSIQSREKSLANYIHLLTSYYAEDDISGRGAELVTAFLKSIKAESSDKETVLALKALGVSLITSPSDMIYDSASPAVKRTITDSESMATKTAAIHTLGVCTFYGGAIKDEIFENMAFLLEIVASDGDSISAQDEPLPVTAALEEWGFLATRLEDLSSVVEEALSTFTDQLSSSYAAVQIAAGENIALIYEKFYSVMEADESFDSDESDDEPNPETAISKLSSYDSAFRNSEDLISNLETLASFNTHRVSKKDQKSVRINFSDILNSIQNPSWGPRYNDATNANYVAFGSRMVVKINQDGWMRIDKWWKMHRLQGLRRVLQGGFVTHYENNSVVFESLP